MSGTPCSAGACRLHPPAVRGRGGLDLRFWQIAGKVDPEVERLPHMLTFAITVQLAMVGVGVYGSDALHSLRISIPRLFVSTSLALLGLALIFFFVPAIPSGVEPALRDGDRLAGLGVVRLTFGRTLAPNLQAAHPGARRRPARGAARADGRAGRGRVPGRGLHQHERRVGCGPRGGESWRYPNLGAHIVKLRADEVVLALEERRNALPSTTSCGSRRPASTSRSVVLSRARDGPGRSRQPQPELADLLRRLLIGSAPVEHGQAPVRRRVSAVILALTAPLIASRLC
jgi:hypothetical protein